MYEQTLDYSAWHYFLKYLTHGINVDFLECLLLFERPKACSSNNISGDVQTAYAIIATSRHGIESPLLTRIFRAISGNESWMRATLFAEGVCTES
jgi:hypothetical protein